MKRIHVWGEGSHVQQGGGVHQVHSILSILIISKAIYRDKISTS